MALVPWAGDIRTGEVKIVALINSHDNVERPSRILGVAWHAIDGFAIVGDADVNVFIPDPIAIGTATPPRKVAALNLNSDGAERTRRSTRHLTRIVNRPSSSILAERSGV